MVANDTAVAGVTLRTVDEEAVARPTSTMSRPSTEEAYVGEGVGASACGRGRCRGSPSVDREVPEAGVAARGLEAPLQDDVVEQAGGAEPEPLGWSQSMPSVSFTMTR